MDDWGSIDFGWGEPQEPKPQKEKTRHLSGRATAVLTHSDKYQMRRAYSEIGILDCVGFSELKEGDRWHFISAGDVDSLSFLKLILRHQDLTYCLFSTWVMAAEDILTFDEWLTAGKIKHLDCYLGEIFPGSYPTEWAMLTEMISRHNKSRGGG